jgi:hypothetical protein
MYDFSSYLLHPIVSTIVTTSNWDYTTIIQLLDTPFVSDFHNKVTKTCPWASQKIR